MRAAAALVELLALVCLLDGVLADGEAVVGGKRTVVVLDDASLRQTHSRFFADLEGV